MSGTTLPIYRLPTKPAAQVGRVRVVIDRNGRAYIDGSKVISAEPSGDFLVLTLASGASYFVKATEYEPLTRPRR